MSTRRRQDGEHRRGVEDSLRSPRDLDQPGELESRPDRQRRRPRGQLGPGEDVELPAEPAGRALLPRRASTWRRRTTSAAACRTTTTGAARAPCAARPASPASHWQTMQGGDGFVVLQDPTDYRIAYSESQDGNMVRVDRVTGETMSIRPQANAGRAAAPLALGHAAGDVAARSEDHLRRRQQGVPLVQPRADLGNASAPTSPATPNRDEIVTMGVKGSDIRIARNDGIQAWPTIVSFAESREARRRPLRRHRRRQRAGDARRRARRGRTSPTRFPGCRRASGCRRSCRRGSTKATVYATFDGHRQNDFETYIYASNDFGQTWRSVAAT